MVNTDNASGSPQRERAGTSEANLASGLLLISSVIINFLEGDDFLIAASILSIMAGFLTIKAAKLEAIEQQIAPGITTFANGLKLIGSHTGLFVSIILFLALLIEVSIKQTTAVAVQSPFAGSVGALLV